MPEDSFHEYVRARMPALFRVAYLLCGDAHLADDLVQHALIRVASRWERVVSAGDPDAYVRKIIYHQHVSWWRRRRGEAVPVAAPPDRNVGDATAGVATSLALRRALARLTSKQRAVLVLRFFEDLTETQTAEAMGCSVNTVKSQTRAALARMRVLIPDDAEVIA